MIDTLTFLGERVVRLTTGQTQTLNREIGNKVIRHYCPAYDNGRDGLLDRCDGSCGLARVYMREVDYVTWRLTGAPP